MDDDQDVGPGIVLDTPEPPAGLPYAEFEDFRARELLRVNGIELDPDSVREALAHPSPVLRGAAAHTAGHLKVTGTLPGLERLVRADDDLVRVEAAYALVRLGRGGGREALHEALSDPVDTNLGPAVAAGDLARLGDPSGYRVVEECLRQDNMIVRILGCKQLLFFVPLQGRPTADGSLVDVWALFDHCLRDPEPEVRRVAALQLDEVDAPEARDLLRRAGP
jgi:HEAT repeat protein